MRIIHTNKNWLLRTIFLSSVCTTHVHTCISTFINCRGRERKYPASIAGPFTVLHFINTLLSLCETYYFYISHQKLQISGSRILHSHRYLGRLGDFYTFHGLLLFLRNYRGQEVGVKCWHRYKTISLAD